MRPFPRTLGRSGIAVLFLLLSHMALPAAALPTALQPAVCSGYPTQAAAQAAYRANPRLTNLDRDNDGFACEDNDAPCDPEPVIRPGVALRTPPDITGMACREVIRNAPAASRVPTAAPIRTATPPSPVPVATPVRPRAQPIPLAAGCTPITIAVPAGTPLNHIAAAITPNAGLRAIFTYDQTTRTFLGYAPHVPEWAINYTATVNQSDQIFICLDAPGQIVPE